MMEMPQETIEPSELIDDIGIIAVDEFVFDAVL